jgi:hypothetical protein
MNYTKYRAATLAGRVRLTFSHKWIAHADTAQGVKTLGKKQEAKWMCISSRFGVSPSPETPSQAGPQAKGRAAIAAHCGQTGCPTASLRGSFPQSPRTARVINWHNLGENEMQKETIHQLIQDKNKELERVVLRSAESVIEQISKQQEVIRAAEEKITELRKELLALEVKQVNAKDILGEE